MSGEIKTDCYLPESCMIRGLIVLWGVDDRYSADVGFGVQNLFPLFIALPPHYSLDWLRLGATGCAVGVLFGWGRGVVWMGET